MNPNALSPVSCIIENQIEMVVRAPAAPPRNPTFSDILSYLLEAVTLHAVSYNEVLGRFVGAHGAHETQGESFQRIGKELREARESYIGLQKVVASLQYTRSLQSKTEPKIKTTPIVIAAVSKNGVIGMGNSLPWKNKQEMELFRALTMQHAVLMGRKTAESIGSPLLGRLNLVVSSSGALCNKKWPFQFDSPELAYNAVKNFVQRCFFIGGESIFKYGLRHSHEAIISCISEEIQGENLVFWPEYHRNILTHEVAGHPFYLSSMGWGRGQSFQGEGFVTCFFTRLRDNSYD